MATLNLTRHAGDTAPHVLQFFTDAGCSVALNLTGRTFAAHVEKVGDVEVLTFATLSPSGAGGNEVELDPDGVGSWADLVRGRRYQWAIWETTGGASGTIFSGVVAVVDR